MGIVVDPTCPLCKSERESIDHLFFKCSYSAWLWKMILWRSGYHRHLLRSLVDEEEWIRLHSKGKGQASTALKLCFSSLIHNLWLERNQRTFENKSRHKRILLQAILSDISIRLNALMIKDKASPWNIASAINFKYKFNPETCTNKFCSWIPPEESELKLNTDASLEAEGGGLGGLIRDSKGMIHSMFSENVDKEEIFELEILAIERGIHLAMSLDHFNIWIESDSKFAVDVVQGSIPPPWKKINVIIHIRDLLSHFKKWRITHIWREGNSVADILSKRSFPWKGCPVQVLFAPPLLLSAVDDDRNGTLFLRL
ncbi:uncharacterized protein LOC143861469 [Tasmannia lanceolata]|uniref:uncharacterized protein LOC143861469 n=1 Tax=Tasmannia lanceolata TaxID=3420 RepID=UPI00406489F5